MDENEIQKLIDAHDDGEYFVVASAGHMSAYCYELLKKFQKKRIVCLSVRLHHLRNAEELISLFGSLGVSVLRRREEPKMIHGQLMNDVQLIHLYRRV